MPSRNIVCNASIFGSDSSFVGGGNGNFIDSTSHAPSTFGIVGGGQQNKICAGTNHSSIFSGYNNCVAGSCSAILSGANNYDGGLNNVFIAGSGITGVCANTLHVNALWANGLPFNPPGPLTPAQGTIFVLPYGSTPSFPMLPSTGVLWIV